MNDTLLVLTGPVGAGKTTVGRVLSEQVGRTGRRHAFIDMDWLRWAYPAPAGDPFHVRLGLDNLRAVAANYRAAGVGLFILADVVETREQRRSYLEAVPGSRLTVVRLLAPVATLHARLKARESAEGYAWHEARAVELTEIMDRNRVEDFVVDTECMTPSDVAAAVWALVN